MSYTALFWLALHIRYGGAPALAAVDAAQCLPILLFSRRAGIIVARHRAARVAMITQGLQAGQTLMLDLVGPGELRRGSSLSATVTGLAKIAGPGVAGIVIAAGGETAVFFINAASFLGVIAVLARLSGRLTPAEAPGREATVVRRLRWLLDLPPGVQAAVVLALLVGGFGLQFAVTNPLMASRVFHLGSVGFGLFGTFMAVGGIAGNYYSSHRKDPGPLEFMHGPVSSALPNA